jgi:hypothetical protein
LKNNQAFAVNKTPAASSPLSNLKMGRGRHGLGSHFVVFLGEYTHDTRGESASQVGGTRTLPGNEQNQGSDKSGEGTPLRRTQRQASCRARATVRTASWLPAAEGKAHLHQFWEGVCSERTHEKVGKSH